MPTTVKTENWDGVSAPSIPSGWVTTGTSVVTSTSNPRSSPNVLAYPSGTTGQSTTIWGVQPDGIVADSIVSSYLYANSALTAKLNFQLYSRYSGSSGASTPLGSANCYVAIVVFNNGGASGLILDKFVGGSETVLVGPVFPSAFVTGQYYKLVLSCIGTTISVQAQRDSDSKWLDNTGTWVTDVSGLTTCASVTDSSVSQSGYSGVGWFTSATTNGQGQWDDWVLQDNGGGGGAGVLAAGDCFVKVASSTSVLVTGTACTGGTAPFTYQYRRSPDGSSWANIGSPQAGVGSGTAPANFTDSGRTAGTIYYYDYQVTDSAGSPATATAATVTVAPHSPTTFYVSPTGSDSNNGTSSGTPWQTLSHASLFGATAGDTVLLEGGQTHTGSLLYMSVAGTYQSPFTIGSYGSGRATISCGNSYGVRLVGCSGINLHDVVVSGSGASSNGTSTNLYNGVEVINPFTTGHLDQVWIDNVEVTGCYSGVEVRGYATSGSAGSGSGFNNVKITNCYSHDILYFGFQVRCTVLLNSTGGTLRWNTFSLVSDRASASNNYQLYAGRAFNGVYIGNCRVVHSYGDPSRNDSTHSGDGIMVKETTNGIVEWCSVFDSGAQGDSPAGIWTQESTNVVIRYCEVGRFHSLVTVDGDAFDMDGGCVNCVVEYCLSHHSDGAGVLCGPYPNSAAPQNCTVRYHVSVNDCQRVGVNAHSPIFPYGGAQLDVYNCVIYADDSSAGLASLVTHGGGRQRHWNNIFLTNTTASVPFLSGTFDNGSLAVGNLYYAYKANPKWNWGGVDYTTLAAFISGAAQETLNSVTVGQYTDPLLSAPGTVADVMPTHPSTYMTAFDQTSGSPTVNAGIDLLTVYGIDMGTTDFHGLPNRYSGGLSKTGIDVGATKYNATALAPVSGSGYSRGRLNAGG
jgi:hypothetical protein